VFAAHGVAIAKCRRRIVACQSSTAKLELWAWSCFCSTWLASAMACDRWQNQCVHPSALGWISYFTPSSSSVPPNAYSTCPFFDNLKFDIFWCRQCSAPLYRVYTACWEISV